MGKYDPLYEYLRSLSSDTWRASFGEIEEVLGFKLPTSARKYSAWWDNEVDGTHVQARAWVEAGWEATELDLGFERVTFVREGRRR